MGWLNRYGNSHHPDQTSIYKTFRIRHILAALLCLSMLIAAFGSFALIIIFIPSPERGTLFPPGISCATCKEIAEHNPLLLRYGNNGAWMGCLGPLTEFDRTTGRNVTYQGFERCWMREVGLDRWLRPKGMTYEDIVKMVGE